MDASKPLISNGPRDTALDMADEMRQLAEHGEWQELERITVMLRRAVVAVPESERAEVLRAVQRTAADVRSVAESARGDVMSRLKALRRGQSAARAYGEATGRYRTLSDPSVRPASGDR